MANMAVEMMRPATAPSVCWAALGGGWLEEVPVEVVAVSSSDVIVSLPASNHTMFMR